MREPVMITMPREVAEELAALTCWNITIPTALAQSAESVNRGRVELLLSSVAALLMNRGVVRRMDALISNKHSGPEFVPTVVGGRFEEAEEVVPCDTTGVNG